MIVPPTRRDGETTCALLREAGLEGLALAGLEELSREIQRGAGAILLTDDIVRSDELEPLLRVLEAQPPWSDLPIVMLMQGGVQSPRAREVIRALRNVTVLDRPTSTRTVVSTAHAAVRTRERQYQIRDQLESIRQAEARARESENALREANRHKDEFIAMLAHELRNPLAPISNVVELLKPEANAETIRWAKDILKRQTKHMVRLVDDLLDVSRIMRGKIQLRLEAVELNSILRHAIEEANPAIGAGKHQFNYALSEEPIWLNADGVRVAQVVSNLLTNAAKYTDPGGKIQLSVESGAGNVVIRVSDSGIGIDAKMLDAIFQPFIQVTDSQARSMGGLGIGLALARNLVLLHGGTVQGQSDGLGKGSEFVVTLPTILPPPPIAANARQPNAIPLRRILVVDDNQMSAKTLGRVLTEFWGHEVAIAHDGPAALEKAAAFKPQVVLLDIGLPGLSGYEVARQLRAKPEFNATFLVALTGYGQADDRQRSFEVGFDEHLVKPASISALERLATHPKWTNV